MEEKSLWSQSASFLQRPALEGKLRKEAAIIGGGMAGILTAHFLQQAGVDCVVLEGNRIGSGQTKNTTAKVTSQHGGIYSRLLDAVGKEKAQQYAALNQDAIRRYRILIEKYEIDCQWEDCAAVLYTSQKPKQLRREYEAAKRLGLPVKLEEKNPLPFPAALMLRQEGQGRFHPLQFLYRIAEELRVYENTKVKRVEGNKIITGRGSIEADHIIFACHYPFLNTPGYYFMRMHQERSYVLALTQAQHLDDMYYGIDQDALSLRSFGETLLLGGGGHRTGQPGNQNPYEYLAHMGDAYWPGCRETARWSAQDCMTLDGIPYIGRYSPGTPDWYVATGFGKWGMTSSMVSAMLLTDLICGRKGMNGEVFSPQRHTISASAANFVKGGGHAAAGLLKQVFQIPKEKLEHIRPKTSAVIEYKGEKYGAYQDEDMIIYAVSLRCPHLGCQLEWNEAEKSWDCPCHGSRFDYKGRRLNGPAQKNLECHVIQGEK